jgi:hypothetical protein
VFVNAVLTSVIDAAKDALSILEDWLAAIVSIRPANEDDVVVNVVFTVVMLAAKDALFVFTVLVKLSNLCAAEELLVVTVP